MKTSEILEAIEKGNYRVAAESACGCRIDWEIRNGELFADTDSDCCWEGNILYIGDEAVAEYLRFEGLKVHGDSDLDWDDLPSAIWDDLRCGMGDVVVRGETGDSPEHDQKMKATLGEFLTELDEKCWMLARDDERGFANEYKLYLIAPEYHIPKNAYLISKESFVADYFYAGDEATEAFVTCEVIQ